jgi:hypothetical protein
VEILLFFSLKIKKIATKAEIAPETEISSA